MQAIFWAMTIMALSFVLMPLVRAKQQGTSALLLIALPAFAALVYLAVGSPDVESATTHAAVDRNESAGVGSVSSLTAGLEARLREQPDDGQGWLLLAKSYVYLQRMDEARHAYARAAELGQSDATVAQQVAGDDASNSRGITGRVSLSASAQQLVQPDDIVFIFARPPGQAGAPVAVMRTSAASWPLEFRLTDSQSMMDGVHLSDYEQVVVTARISRRDDTSGALRRLEARSQPIDVTSETPVLLTIE
jgi:hypothetical protein